MIDMTQTVTLPDGRTVSLKEAISWMADFRDCRTCKNCWCKGSDVAVKNCDRYEMNDSTASVVKMVRRG